MRALHVVGLPQVKIVPMQQDNGDVVFGLLGFTWFYYHSNNLDWYGYSFILLTMFQLLSSQVPHDFVFISMHQRVVCVIKFLWGKVWISGEKSGAGPGHAKWSCCLLLMAWDVSSGDMRAVHVSLPQVKIPNQIENCKEAYQDNGDVVFGLIRFATIRMI